MKIIVELRLEVTGKEVRNIPLLPKRKWRHVLTGRKTVSSNAKPNIGEFLHADIFYGHVGYDFGPFMQIQFLRVEQVIHDDKADVLHPRIVCGSRFPLHFSGLHEYKGEEWMKKIIVPALDALGYQDLMVE